MTSIVIVSGSDHNYFPLLREMIQSIKRFPQARDFKFAVMDTGLTEEDLVWLRANVDYIHAPDWPTAIPAYKIRGRNYLKSCVCRPWINTYFPGHDVYVWMDADTWVQDWEGFALFLEGADRGKLAIAGQVDRAYPRAVRIKWLGPLPLKLRGFYFSNAKQAFGLKLAKKLYPHHVLQAGVFALRGDAPHWARWQELVLQSIKRGKIFTAEQLCLGVLCYLEGFSFESLPAWAQWLCEVVPPFDESKGCFVEPFLPNKTISILHISGFDAMRRDRSVLTTLTTTSGRSYEGTLRNPHYNGETDITILDTSPERTHIG
ncbi:MAG: glycosyl transferase family 8 [Pseudobdellovibrionaceae bacterium]